MTRSTLHLACLVLAGLTSVAATAAEPLVNRLSLAEGAIPVVNPPSYSGYPALNVLDDGASTGWASKDGETHGQTMVFELPDPATFERFEFDVAGCVDGKGRGVKDVKVSVSSTSAKEGFTPVLQAALKEKKGQKFPVKTKATGRWVKLEVVSNHGDKKYAELCSFRGFAPPAEPKALPDISGTYKTNYADFHVRQQGTALGGCYEYQDGLLNGSVEGRVMRITWSERDGASSGPAVMVFSPDGKTFHGYWWAKTDKEKAPSGEWNGTLKSTTVGTCPNWSGSVGGVVAQQLEKGGRAVLYGIQFDLDSAELQARSKPVLDEVASALKAHPDWKLSVEGHTDSQGSAKHNQQLSEKRAESVRTYLGAHGVDAARLTSVGFGASKPVADNATELGRSQNRRVEIVKK